MAVSSAKKTASKSPTKKSATSKKPAAKRPRKTSTRKVSAEERYKMIEVAAYYIAEQHNFEGNPLDFWAAAEAEINS
jgi:Protein of unknown function (DUF2934)